MPRIISAIAAIQATASKRKPELTTRVNTSARAITSFGMQQATIDQP